MCDEYHVPGKSGHGRSDWKAIQLTEFQVAEKMGVVIMAGWLS